MYADSNMDPGGGFWPPLIDLGSGSSSSSCDAPRFEGMGAYAGRAFAYPTSSDVRPQQGSDHPAPPHEFPREDVGRPHAVDGHSGSCVRSSLQEEAVGGVQAGLSTSAGDCLADRSGPTGDHCTVEEELDSMLLAGARAVVEANEELLAQSGLGPPAAAAGARFDRAVEGGRRFPKAPEFHEPSGSQLPEDEADIDDDIMSSLVLPAAVGPSCSADTSAAADGAGAGDSSSGSRGAASRANRASLVDDIELQEICEGGVLSFLLRKPIVRAVTMDLDRRSEQELRFLRRYIDHLLDPSSERPLLRDD